MPLYERTGCIEVVLFDVLYLKLGFEYGIFILVKVLKSFGTFQMRRDAFLMLCFSLYIFVGNARLYKIPTDCEEVQQRGNMFSLFVP